MFAKQMLIMSFETQLLTVYSQLLLNLSKRLLFKFSPEKHSLLVEYDIAMFPWDRICLSVQLNQK